MPLVLTSLQYRSLGLTRAAAGLIAVVILAVAATVVTLTVLSTRGSPSRTSLEPYALTASSEITTPVILSMTTSPQRLASIRQTLEHLYFKQTLRPDAIELNLPHTFLRDNTTYDMSAVPFAGEPFLHVNRCEDLGPITKFVPTLRKYRDTQPEALIIVVDDDIQYPSTLVEELVRAARTHPGHLVTGHCLSGYYTLNRGHCDLLEGYMSYLLRPHLFDPADFEPYLAVALQSPSCFRGDDYVLSNYVLLRDIPVLKLDLPAVREVVPLVFGLQPDALHRQVAVPERERYCACYTDLVAMGVTAPLRTFCGSE